MADQSWQLEVARLFAYCAECLKSHNERQAIVAFGTAIAYLQRAQDEGQRTAVELLQQFDANAGDGQTQRFSFAPGELEQLAKRDRG